MSNENQLTPQQQFENSIKDRLRKDIGDLLPNEVLAELVKKAIEDMFFVKRTTRDSYGYTTTSVSWFEEEVAKQMKTQIAETIKAHFIENGRIIAKAIETE